MGPKSVLQLFPAIMNVNAFYMNYAASIDDPIERFKIFMTSTVAFMY